MSELSLELEREGSESAVILRVAASLSAVVAAVREYMGAAAGELHLFEKDQDEELASVEGRRAIAIVAHTCRLVSVSVNFGHETKTERFPPSATVSRVLRWATGKKGFDLDDDPRAKANLMLPGADQPLPKDAAIGRYISTRTCCATVDLTLKDFSNG